MNKHRIEEPEIVTACPNCGGADVVTAREQQTFLYGAEGTPLKAIVPVRICKACAFQFTDFEAEEAREQAIRDHLQLPSAEQVQAIRKAYGTRAAFAELSGLGSASLARWELGTLMPSTANARYLFLLNYEDNIRRVKEKFLEHRIDSQVPQPANQCRVFRAIQHEVESIHQRALKWKLRKKVGI